MNHIGTATLRTASLMVYACCAALASQMYVQSYGQDTIYRCGNLYTNTPPPAEPKGCELISKYGLYLCGNLYTNTPPPAEPEGCEPVSAATLTVRQLRKPTGVSNAPNANNTVTPSVTTSNPISSKIDPSEQRSKDNESRRILEAELGKAQALHSELLAQYNNGKPVPQGSESTNYAKYSERVASLKAAITRNENDIAALGRELARLPVNSTASK